MRGDIEMQIWASQGQDAIGGSVVGEEAAAQFEEGPSRCVWVSDAVLY